GRRHGAGIIPENGAAPLRRDTFHRLLPSAGAAAHDAEIGAIRLAAIGEGAETGPAPGANRSIFARAELRLWRRTVPAAPALARMQDAEALRPRHAGVGEGLAVATALTAYRGVFESAGGGPVLPWRPRTRSFLDDGATGDEQERQAGQQDGTGTGKIYIS